MDNVGAVRNVSLIEASLNRQPQNDDRAREIKAETKSSQVSARRLPSFEAAYEAANELDELIAQMPDQSMEAHFGITRERVRELLR